uniref:Genome polyprotein n=1 Tax=Wenling scaldfish picornavirus 1 TaxID=2116430 RepID=A0A2P1GN75_9VIRU|nr:polyprotein [Wenling scaldfish picornavirus 1]
MNYDSTTKMNKIIDNLAGGAKAMFLSDPEVEEKEVASDRVGGIVSSNASAAGQAEVQHQTVFNPATAPRDVMRSQGFKVQTAAVNPGKLVLLHTGEWSGTAESNTLLFTIDLPQAFIGRNSLPAFGQAQYFRYLRTGYTFNVQVNASVGVSGSVLAVFTPAEVKDEPMDSALLKPHCLINVGVATNGVLRIPYTSYLNYVGINSAGGGSLKLFVWSKLRVPTGTVNSMTVTVYGSMDDLDMQNPQPIVAKRQGPIRQNVDIGPGPGNMVLAGGRYTTRATDLALCGEVTEFDTTTCGTSKPITNILQLLKIPMPMMEQSKGQFLYEWPSSAVEGTRLSEHYVGMAPKATAGETSLNRLFDFLSNCYAMWRGSLVFAVTVFGNPLSRGRLRLAFFPNSIGHFDMDQCDNALYTVCDIGIQSTHEMVVPFSNVSWLRQTSSADNGERIYGMLGVFVSNRLIVTAATPASLDYMITCRAGDDFEFVMPISRGRAFQGDERGNVETVAVAAQGEAVAAAAGLDSMENTDYKNEKVGAPRTLNAEVVKVTTVKADHMDVQALFGRAQRVGEITVEPNVVQYWQVPYPAAGFMSILRLFAYWAGDLCIHIYNSTDFTATVAHTYVTGMPTDYDSITAFGSVVVKSKEFVSIDAPFYSATVARHFQRSNALGQLVVHCYGAGALEVYVSFRRINLYFPVGVPRPATARSFIKEHRMSVQPSLMSRALDMVDSGRGDELLVADVEQMPPSPRAQRQMRQRVALRSENAWIRDLTAEGIESNPGPYLEVAGPYEPDVVGVLRLSKVVETEILCELPGLEFMDKMDIVTTRHPEWNGWQVLLFVARFCEKETLLRVLKEMKCVGVREPLTASQRRQMANTTAMKIFGADVVFRHLREAPSQHGTGTIEYGIRFGNVVMVSSHYGELNLVPHNDGVSSWEEGEAMVMATLRTNARINNIPMPDLVRYQGRLCWWSVIAWVNLLAGVLMLETDGYCSTENTRWVMPFVRRNSAWIRDLTTEGIEPNPGPRLVPVRCGTVCGLEWQDGVIVLDGTSEGARFGLQIVHKTAKWEAVEDGCNLAMFLSTRSTNRKYEASIGVLQVAEELAKPFRFCAVRVINAIGDWILSLYLVAGKQGKLTEWFAKLKHEGTTATAMRELFMGNFLEKIEVKIVKKTFKCIVRCLCYGLLFAGSPGAVSAMAVGTLVAMDVACAEGLGEFVDQLTTAMLSGDTESMVDAVGLVVLKNTDGDLSMLDELKRRMAMRATATRQGLKDFNVVSTGAKNVEWWMKTIHRFWAAVKDWLQPDDQSKAALWLEENAKEVLGVMAEADELLMQSSAAGVNRGQAHQQAIVRTVRVLASLKQMCLKARQFPLLNTISHLHMRLSTVPRPPVAPLEAVRLEPLGIAISGDPGCGKSLFCMTLLAKLARRMEGWFLDNDPSKAEWVHSIYYHPTGSAFFDNYDGQCFHVFDDLAQIRDEEDIKPITNIISTIPFSVPMADCSDKGKYYTSHVVAATTNLKGFSGLSTVVDYHAIERRFGFKLRITPNREYIADGKLNVTKATQDGATDDGSCWVIERCDSLRIMSVTQVDIEELVDEMFRNYVLKIETHRSFVQKFGQFKTTMTASKQSGGDEVEKTYDEIAMDLGQVTVTYTPFKSMNQGVTRLPFRKPTEEQTKWYKDLWDKYRAWYEKVRPWVAGVVGVMSVLGTLLTLWKVCADHGVEKDKPLDVETEEQRPYNSTMGPHKMKIKKAVVVKQGPHCGQEYVHLLKACGFLTLASGEIVHILCLRGGRAMVYEHALDILDVVSLSYNGLTCPIAPGTVAFTPIQLCGGASTDSAYLDFEGLPFQFRDMTKHVRAPQESRSGCLLYATPEGNVIHTVADVKTRNCLVLSDPGDDDVFISNAISYVAHNEKGMCGGVLIQKQSGRWCVVGMHNAGDDKVLGFATPLYTTAERQGVVVSKTVVPPHFTPTTSKLRKSPFHGVFPVTMGPAPLSPRDPRLDVKVENLVKSAASKYNVDVFKPDPGCFARAVNAITERIYSAVGTCGCVTMEDALNGCGESAEIDLKTSPGVKYVREGLTKKDLIKRNEEGRLTATKRFAKDVEATLQAAKEGKAGTIFAATLKDEVVKNGKISMGKTRCIEACSVDFVVAHRMVLGRVFDRIYSSPAISTTVAVGINPYLDYNELALAMKDKWYAGDYACYDGSLSEELMNAGVEVLAACHEDPALVRSILAPVVNSVHLVSDELWMVKGGMPSGSPCTSVLNSICNTLAFTTCALSAGLGEPRDLTIVTYGDDLLASCDEVLDGPRICEEMRESFGMTLTSADKMSCDLSVSPSDATFLKRHLRPFPGTTFVVGRLELASMTQKIMWCRNMEDFTQQLRSFLIELVLHGQTVYDNTLATLASRAQVYKIHLPPYKLMREEVFHMFFY